MVSRLIRLRSAKDRLRSAGVKVGRGDIVDTLVVAGVIVVLDLPFEITG
jgi:hypothetical protein